MTQADPQVLLCETLPAFEEETAPRLEPGPVARTVLDEHSEQGEQCRLLGSRLVALGRDKRLRRIGVVASSAGEGTTTVALGLARALSRDRRRRVLLLELDLRRPLLGGDDHLALQDHLDGFVLVVRSRRAPRETIQRAAARLRPDLVVGLVLNAQHDVLRRRR